MRRPGLTFAQVFQNVRKRVLERQRASPPSVSGRTPIKVSQLTRDHYFAPPSGAPIRNPGTAGAPWTGRGRSGSRSRGTSSAGGPARRSSLAHGGSRYAALAKLRLGELQPWVAGQFFSDALKSGGRGPEMVVVPAGAFRKGCLTSDHCRGDELPAHEVRIGRPFALGRYEVTFAEWDACVSAGGCRGYRPGDYGWGRDDRPVVEVSWEDARSYVQWLSRETGARYRLPSEAEWEYAARAGTMTKYHFGNDESELCRYGNHADSSTDYDLRNQSCSDGFGKETAPAGSFGANAFGLHDMHGNVWEWAEECWNGSYAGALADGSAWLSGDCGERVLRGGAWVNTPSTLRAALRVRNATAFRAYSFGFRVARMLTP